MSNGRCHYSDNSYMCCISLKCSAEGRRGFLTFPCREVTQSQEAQSLFTVRMGTFICVFLGSCMN